LHLIGHRRGRRLPAAPDDEATRAIAGLQLDDTLALARSGSVDEALTRLVASLAAVRDSAAPETWARVMAAARAHPLRGFMHLDPFTLRCYARPRGHVADAAALDFVLRPREIAIPVADPAAALHQWIIRGHAARALRLRRDALARAIEDSAARSDRPARIFAAACGHLRECDHLTPFTVKRVGQIVAFDTDPDNLERVRRDHGGLPLVTYLGSVRELVRGEHLFGDMDLVYCTGLMEALPQPSAAGLARALFSMLRPGGILVLTHFLDRLAEAALLETYMDWHMVYRSRPEAIALVHDLLPDSVSEWSYVENAERTMGFVTLQRR
jgi:SAM-dependent methyltransferase